MNAGVCILATLEGAVPPATAMDRYTKIDIAKTHPYLSSALHGEPLPEDNYLHIGIGADYHKYSEMRRDPKVRSLLQRRRRGVVSRAVIPEAVHGKARDKFGIDHAREIADRMGYDRMVNALLNTGYLIGFAAVQIDWELTDDRQYVLPRWKFVPQDRFIFREHEPENFDIAVAGGEELNPATDIILNQGWELRLLTRAHPHSGERCPKGRFIFYNFDSSASPWGLGLGYSIYPWYLIKREASAGWVLHSDRIGSPPVIGRQPEGIRESDPEVLTVLDRFDAFLEAVSPSGAWVRLPQGYEVDLSQAFKNTSPENQEKLIHQANAEISFAIIGEQLYSDKSHGSYGAANAQNDTIDATLIDGDIDELDPQLNEQLWTVVQELNYSRAQYIYVRRQTSADLDEDNAQERRDAKAKRRLELDEALESKMGLVLPYEVLRERYGDEYVPLRDSGRPLSQALGEKDGERILNFLATSAPNMERDAAIATLTVIFGISTQDAERLIPERPPATEDVQAAALNGSQITGLLEIAKSVARGSLPIETAIRVALTAFPRLDEAQARTMLTPAIGTVNPDPEPAPTNPSFAEPTRLTDAEMDAIANLDLSTDEGQQNLTTVMEAAI